jgi:hypothetical protein
VNIVQTDRYKQGQVKVVSEDRESFSVHINYPVEFQSSSLSGNVDFGINIQFKNNYVQQQDKNLWNVALVRSPTAKLSNERCSGASQ